MRRLGWMCAAVVISVVGLAPPAQAGGPTSVLLASPTLQKAAALYVSSPEYAQLADAVGIERSAVPDRSVPKRLGIGPGSGSINVTWLMHDVWVWRVDRVQIEPNGTVWLNTTIEKDGDLAVEDDGVWHRAGQPKELVALLTKLGVWDGVGTAKADPGNGVSTDAGAAVPPAGGEPKQPAQPVQPVTAPVATSSGSLAWWWAAAALLVGVLLGFGWRPATRLAGRLRARNKAAGPRQQVLDA